MKLIFCLVGLLGYLLHPLYMKEFKSKDCVSVSPGGVTGFWEVLPKIKKIAKDSEILCASSGCIASVAKDLDFHYVFNLATFIKNTGEPLENMKNIFIKTIVSRIKTIPKLTIVTMDEMGKCYHTKPVNKTHLMELLVETSDIPYFTTHKNKGKLDGAVCFFYTDKCKTKIRRKFNINNFLNSLNFNLTELEAFNLYNYNIH